MQKKMAREEMTGSILSFAEGRGGIRGQTKMGIEEEEEEEEEEEAID